MAEQILVSPITDPLYKDQWNLQMLNIDENVWTKTTGRGVKVAILDSGLDYVHNDLGWDKYVYIDANDSETARKAKTSEALEAIRKGTHPKVGGGWNFMDDNDDVYELFRHGTEVAGVVSNQMDGFGLVGVAPDSMLYPYVVINRTGWGTPEFIAKGINKAVEEGCKVINISLAFTYTTQSLTDAINNVPEDVIVVSATGNNNKLRSMWPGIYDKVLEVGGCNSKGTRWVHDKNIGSNWNSNIMCTLPGDAQKVSFWMRWRQTDGEGTSLATAHMTGIVALLKELKPSITLAEVKELISKYSSLKVKDEQVGYGVPNVAAMVDTVYNDTDYVQLAAEIEEMSIKLEKLAQRVRLLE